MNKFTLIIISIIFSSCATSYGPKGFTGGYEDYVIDEEENIYFVAFYGNGYTPASTARVYAQKRAKELCNLKGFRRFRTLDKNSDVTYMRTANNINCNSYGTSTSCQNYGGHIVSKPSSDLKIQCYKKINGK